MGPSVDKLINPIRRDTSCIDDDSHVDKLINPVRHDTSCIDDDSHVENTSGTKINI